MKRLPLPPTKIVEVINLGRGRFPELDQVFAYRMRGVYRFCRVIKTDTGYKREPRPWPLTYFYRPEATTLDVIPQLRKDDLLIPPQLLWGEIWMNGFMLPVPYPHPLSAADILDHHSFIWWSREIPPKKSFVDEYGNPLEHGTEPCAMFAAMGMSTLDSKLSVASGIVQSTKEFYSLPDLPPSPLSEGGPKVLEVMLEFPAEELNSLQIGSDQIEDALEKLLKPKLGKWVESGFDMTASSHQLFYEVKSKAVPQFLEVTQTFLKSIGVRRYSLKNAETGELLNG